MKTNVMPSSKTDCGIGLYVVLIFGVVLPKLNSAPSLWFTGTNALSTHIFVFFTSQGKPWQNPHFCRFLRETKCFGNISVQMFEQVLAANAKNIHLLDRLEGIHVRTAIFTEAVFAFAVKMRILERP